LQPWYKRVWQDEQNYLPTTPVDYTKLRCVACSAVLPPARFSGCGEAHAKGADTDSHMPSLPLRESLVTVQSLPGCSTQARSLPT